MKTIFIFPGNQPCLKITTLDINPHSPNFGKEYGINRDRNPDSGWNEIRQTIMEQAKEVELTDELRKTVIEDLAFMCGYNSENFRQEMDRMELW